jgi:2-hydroxymuconate-semialdehyde hydrolase
MRIRHIARFCDELEVDSAHFVGNPMGAINLLTDATSDSRVLPMRSIAPGAWAALAAARFRRPGAAPPPAPSSKRVYQRVVVPALLIEGGGDKLLAPGWAKEVADQIRRGYSAVIEAAGHCPQIEQPATVNQLLPQFLDRSRQTHLSCADDDAVRIDRARAARFLAAHTKPAQSCR